MINDHTTETVMINKSIQIWIGAGLLLIGMVLNVASLQAQTAKAEGPELSYLQKVDLLWNANPAISLKLEEMSLEQALIEAAREARAGFYAESSMIPDKTVSLDVTQTPIGEVLKTLLEGTGLEAYTSGRNIMLRERTQTTTPLPQPVVEEIDRIQQSVTGVVVDASSGEALPGVNILVMGTGTGVATNMDGEFELSVQDLNQTLVVTYIGYQRQEVAINGQADIEIRLQPLILEGEEMVVTAFGIAREAKSLSYSTQGVNVETLTEARELNVMSSLQGKVAGLNISSSSSGLGSPTRVVLRGNRSISGSSQPLYVVDGVPISGNPQDINPDDIVSIDVLKGPNAAALYGSAAQNGAIVMTTRRAQAGQVNVSLSNTFMTETPILTIPFQNQYGQGSGGVYSPTSEYSWGPEMNGQQVAFWTPNPNHELFGSTYSMTPQPDNVRDLFQTGYSNSTNITASMGGDRTNTTFSYTLTNAEGMVPGNQLARQNISVSVGSQVTDRLTLDSRIVYMQQAIDNQVATGEGFTNPMRNAYRIPRSIQTQHLSEYEYIDNNGLLRQNYFNPGSNGGNNPYWVLNRRQSQNDRERVLAMSSLTYQFNEMVSLMVRGAYDGSFNSEDIKTWGDSYVTADQGLYVVGYSNSREWNGDFLLSAERQLNQNFDANINLGGSLQMRRNGGLEGDTNRDVGLTVPNLFAMSNTQNVLVSHNVGSPRDTQSLYGFGEVSYLNSIFLNLTGRNDWSSTLPADARSYFYPSVGLSVVLSDLLPAFPDAITFARIRASWAKVGSSASPYSLNRVASVTAGGRGGYLSLDNTLPNTSLKPEQTISRELGLDLRFFNGRLGFDVTGYIMNTENQLFTVALPIGSGAGEYFTNGGDVENKGVEVVVSTTPVQTMDLNWDLNFTFGLNRNTVVSISEERPRVQISSNFIRDHVIEEGEPFGNIYSRDLVRDSQGRVLIDSNGLPQVTAGRTELVANYNPDWTGGISNQLAYRNWSASFLIDHRQGGTIVSQSDAIIYADGVVKQTLEGRGGGLVFGENFFEEETAVLASDGSPNTLAIDAESFWRHVGGRNAPVGGMFVESATNTRMREMTLGYTLPQAIVSSLPISGAKVSLVGRNLFFIYKASENNDPDILTGTGEGSEGLNAFALPTARSFGVNLKVDF